MPAYNDTPDIMNVRQIIELAFGDFEGNTVNFKLVQTVLYLLARQLRLLERRVDVELGPITVRPSDTTLSVTEVKIHAMQKKIAKKKEGKDKSAGPGAGADVDADAGAGAGVGRKGKKSGRPSTDKSSSDKTSTDKASSDKSSTYKTSSSDKTSTDKTTSSDKTSTDKTSSGKTTSSDKTSTDKTSSGKTTSSDKTSTDKTSSGKTTSSDKTSTDKTSSGKTTSSDKTSSAKTTSSSKDKSSSKSSSGKSGEKTAPSRKKPDTYSDILNTLEEQREKELRIIHQRADSFEETTKSPTPMASVGSIQAQYEKILVVERVSSTESGVGETVQGQKRSPQISVVTQEQFERIAQAVRQLQSKLLPVGTPGFPEHAELMEELRRGASLTDAMAALQLSARLEATEKAIAQMIAMVTELARQTPGLELDSETQALFEAPGVPFNTAAARQKEFKAATDSVTGTLGAPSSALSSAQRGGGASESGRGPPGSGRSAKSGVGSKAGGSPAAPTLKSQDTSRKYVTPAISTVTATQTSGKPQDYTATTQATLTTSEKSVASGEMTSIPQTSIAAEAAADEFAIKPDYITFDDLEVAAKKIEENLMNTVTAITTRTTNNADKAYKLVLNIDSKVEAALTSASHMSNLEKLVKQYADQINALDTGLSSQMTNYQEQITQMQHDLEIGLETMAEVLANAGGDTVAVTELNSHFTGLQLDFENMLYRQRDLRDAQNAIAFDLENLWKEIETLRDTKSDREEVVDALRDKAGICELNGLVSLQQFDAVRGDFEKRIRAAYDKFNNQEIVWQKAIDDLEKELNEKADLIQVESLKNEIDKYLNIMKDRMQVIIDIVGEPKSAMLSKKLFRNTACLSCGNPAHMDIEAPVSIPALQKFHSARQPAEGAEAETKSKGGGDYGICYADFPIPHPRDPRSHVCQRYCGGSHTVLTEGPSRAPPSIVIQQALRPVSTEPGTDGKMYLVDQQIEKIPCLACNMPKPTPVASEPDNQAPTETISGDNKNISAKSQPAQEIATADSA